MNVEFDKPATCYLGLGGNVGDVVASFKSAIRELDNIDGQRILAVSPVYKTPPWGFEDQNWFHNACIKLETGLEPEQLLKLCKRIEFDLKRKKTMRWGPRTIDIDILLYADRSVDTEGLTIPHAQMLNRAFVLKPLGDIAKGLQIGGKRVNKWLDALDETELQEIKLPQGWWQKSDRNLEV